MKAPSFEYVEPDDLVAAVRLLASDDEARALAGGQSLVPMLNFRLAQPTMLVGLRRLVELQGIERGDGVVRIGAMVTQAAALTSNEVSEACPLVADALAWVGHPQIRSRGTVGGTLAHGDPGAELPAALRAIDGSVTVAGPDRSRSVPADQLFAGPYTTALEPGEIITEIHVPVAPDGSGSACVEVSRRPGDFALLGAACQLTIAEGGISDARVALFAVADVPLRATAVERSLIGAQPTPETWAGAAPLATDALDERSSGGELARYRRRVVPAIVTRALAAAAERAR